MPDEINNTNTSGGAYFEGSLSTGGGDVVGRDQYNYYTLLPNSKPEYSLVSSLSKEELGAIYRKATTAHFNGDLIQAKVCYEMVARHEPDYPGVAQSLHAINKELARPYVDMHGRVHVANILKRSAGRDLTKSLPKEMLKERSLEDLEPWNISNKIGGILYRILGQSGKFVAIIMIVVIIWLLYFQH